ncbi:MAG TPA: DUF1582 domain-containing protein [Rhodopirellula baltica]|nr:DUF1582 domain-containing protein [Rhodopirellula baltica]
MRTPLPEFSLNARIPTLPNSVQEGDFNLASTTLKNSTPPPGSEETFCFAGSATKLFRLFHARRALCQFV